MHTSNFGQYPLVGPYIVPGIQHGLYFRDNVTVLPCGLPGTVLYVDIRGQAWTSSDKRGQAWTSVNGNVDKLGQARTNVDKFGQSWTNLTSLLNSHMTHFVKTVM
jgi:hypothetical protein